MNSLHKAWYFATILLLLAVAAVLCIAQKPAPAPTFTHDILPVLQARCVVCHNQQMLSTTGTSGGLDLGSYEALKKGVASKSGAVSIISGGKSQGGALIERISSTSPTRMMPKGGPPLPPEQIALLRDGLRQARRRVPRLYRQKQAHWRPHLLCRRPLGFKVYRSRPS